MDAWISVYRELGAITKRIDTGTPWFRGHSNATWRLQPTLARCRPTTEAELPYYTDEERESGTYGEFVAQSGPLLAPNDGWAPAFAMQHHGLPTRLLDWSTVFGVALHFALRSSEGDAAVWILDPFELNRILIGREETFELYDCPGDYREMFIRRKVPLGAAAIALNAPRQHPRVFNQRGGFTLHADLAASLEDLAPAALHKLTVPADARSGARDFLRFAGISEFSLFPDLDGLARDFRAMFF